MFEREELRRYHRQIIMPEVDMRGQNALNKAKVLVVGAGGLGAPILLYLAAAGVGTIGIVDHDCVALSNLHRQVLFNTEDIGLLKVECAKKRLTKLNPHIKIFTYPTALSSDNAIDIISSYDIIVDGTDNFPTRYLINDACIFQDKIHVYGSIFRFEGQVSVFNHLDVNNKRGPNYRDLFPSPPPPNSVPDCATAGVMGVLPGIVGSMQANECIKVIIGTGEVLSGKLLVIDTLDYNVQVLKFRKRKDNPITGENKSIHSLIDYEEFCGLVGQKKQNSIMKSIDVHSLKSMFDNKEDFQLIDVREAHERQIASIGGELIPLAQVFNNIEKIASDKKVIFYCRSGVRSANAIRLISSLKPFDNLYNLEGGILAWADQIDTSLTKY